MLQFTRREVNSLRMHAQAKFQQGDYKTAKRCFVEIFEKSSAAGQDVPTAILFNAAMCYFQFKNYERVVEYLTMVLKRDPFSAICCFYLGICYKITGEITDICYFEEAVNCMRRQPSHPYLNSSTRVSKHPIDIDTINYKPLGLDMVLTQQDCELMQRIEISEELPENVDFRIFQMKVIHSAGLQRRDYIKPHITIRKNTRKLEEVSTRMTKNVETAFLRNGGGFRSRKAST